MDSKFSFHNSHWDDPKLFELLDPQLRRLKKQPFVFHSPLLQDFPTKNPGVYTLTGGRQVGKTTLLKQWMLALLKKKFKPKQILFLSGELIDDQHVLFRLIQEYLRDQTNDQLYFLLLDEITYIKNWDKAIKYAADSGLFDQVIVMITGSDLNLIQATRMRFPGRRGIESMTNFHFYPLSFKEALTLKQPQLDINKPQSHMDLIYAEFQSYLIHGGYLTAINDLATHQKILSSTLNTYSDWIRGDMIKQGKKEFYLREVLSAIIKRYGSQVTWNALARDLSIDHPSTVSDYVETLAAMDVLIIQQALLEDKLTGAPKKSRKIIFKDPFIFHAVNSWIFPNKKPNAIGILTDIDDGEAQSQLVESIIISHYDRYYPTYYIKAAGEVDLAYIDQEKFWPVEIKWTNQLHPKDLKQISKYTNARILTKNKDSRQILAIPTTPIPLDLLDLPNHEHK